MVQRRMDTVSYTFANSLVSVVGTNSSQQNGTFAPPLNTLTTIVAVTLLHNKQNGQIHLILSKVVLNSE